MTRTEPCHPWFGGYGSRTVQVQPATPPPPCAQLRTAQDTSASVGAAAPLQRSKVAVNNWPRATLRVMST